MFSFTKSIDFCMQSSRSVFNNGLNEKYMSADTKNWWLTFKNRLKKVYLRYLINGQLMTAAVDFAA